MHTPALIQQELTRGSGRKIVKKVGQAIGDFQLTADGDKILVAVSGGKDSLTMLHVLRRLQVKAPVKYHLEAAYVDNKFEEFDRERLVNYMARIDIPFHIIPAGDGGINEIIIQALQPGDCPCSLCSRVRRGVLYDFAWKRGFNKLALGHHMDDFVETLLLNLFFIGQIKGMSANLLCDDGKGRVIRPLVYVPEELIVKFAYKTKIPVQSCGCPYSQGDLKRKMLKTLLENLHQKYPGIKNSILSAMDTERVNRRHLLNLKS